MAMSWLQTAGIGNQKPESATNFAPKSQRFGSELGSSLQEPRPWGASPQHPACPSLILWPLLPSTVTPDEGSGVQRICDRAVGPGHTL